jgi:hypothetical protein
VEGSCEHGDEPSGFVKCWEFLEWLHNWRLLKKGWGPEVKKKISLVCEAIDSEATAALLCQPRVIVKMIVEKQMECRLTGETEVLGENLPRRHFCPSQNPTWPDPGLNPGRRGGKPATNRLSYGAARPVSK